uniref:PHD-type domain-containing protein n=1 Tax=Setaria digitata TaxID=48799 RepID=A0A915PZZ1_9BILA
MPTEAAVDSKVKRRKKMRRKKSAKEITSEDELVKKQLNAKFKMKTQRPNNDDIPCLRLGKKEQMVVKNGEKHDILLKRSQEALLNRLNQIECNEVKIITRWKCALCQQRTLRSVLGDLFGPYFIRLKGNHWPAHLAKKPQKTTDQDELYCDIWLHGPCALTAPGIYLVGNQLDGLETKISTFWAQHCAVCSKEGAAIENRGKYYHFPCALQKDMLKSEKSKRVKVRFRAVRFKNFIDFLEDLAAMEKVTYEFQEKAVVVVWDWASVQVPLDKIALFINKIRSAVVENLDEHHARECAFLVYCDARFTPLAITRELAKSPNVDIHHIESHESSWGICKKLHRFHVDYDPGIVALISGASAAYGPVLTKLSRCGWRVQLFHPSNAPRDYVDYGDHNWPVERLLDGEIGAINISTNFPHTVYFLVSELCNSDESLSFLSTVTEQYESNVIYFNEKAAEAVVELKAFDVERLFACEKNLELIRECRKVEAYVRLGRELERRRIVSDEWLVVLR